MVLLYRCSDSHATTKDSLLSAIEVDIEVLLKSAGYMRREGFTGGATYEEIIQMSIHSQKAEFDTLISDIDYHRKDFTHLLQFHKDHAGGKALTDKALASLGFYPSAPLQKRSGVFLVSARISGLTFLSSAQQIQLSVLIYVETAW